ncbi:MAG TPA: hypothetical protein VMQ86_25545 [Bryobacteraceae bacterium]|jgi:hypothetical protein|nr:hypothetical protein [Bryobacteraceae bacterium]
MDEPKRAGDGEFEPGKEGEKKGDEHKHHGETADEKKKREDDEARKRHK